jgi:DNA-binding transcriptional MocR family regulator
MSLPPGSMLGPYEVLSPLGARGMGEVYRARDPRLNREVAIKVMPAERVADLRRTRQIYRRRRDVLIEALRAHCPDVRIQGVAAGLHVLLELLCGIDEDAVVREAQEQSIRVYGARAYWARPGAPPARLVGYGGLPESRIRQGVEILARVLKRSDSGELTRGE